MAQSESNVRLEVKLKGVLPHTSSRARILKDGHIELEYYDFSPEANDNFGNDVAWIYRIDASQKPRLYAGLGATDDPSLLDTFVRRFGDVKLIRDWLRNNEIPFDEEFDSWA